MTSSSAVMWCRDFILGSEAPLTRTEEIEDQTDKENE